MRLWHYKLIPYLSDKLLITQWRDCIAIKRQWEKGNLKDKLVSYVMNYDKSYFTAYVLQVVSELSERHINYNKKLYDEILLYSNKLISGKDYPEHDSIYFEICYSILSEKSLRNIISNDDFIKIYRFYKEEIRP